MTGCCRSSKSMMSKLLRVLTDRGSEYCGNPERHEYELYLAVEDYGSITAFGEVVTAVTRVSAVLGRVRTW